MDFPEKGGILSRLPTPSEHEDNQAMIRLAKGDDSALDMLMERHGQKVFHYLIRLLQSEPDAEDLAQETFARVYRHRSRFDTDKLFSTWLYAIATNLARNMIRWRTRHPRVALEGGSGRDADAPGLIDTLPSNAAAPDKALIREERIASVREAIEALPEELRAPLVLAEYEDLAQAEIAEILGCTVKAVETRLYRARKKLRARLQGNE